MDICIAANCQITPLRKILAATLDFNVVHSIDVNAKGSPAYETQIAGALEKLQEGRAIFLSHPFSEKLGPIATEKLRGIKGYYTFTNIYFNGLHPDIVMMGGFQRRLKSPIGDYHSRIAVACYLAGLSVEECVRRFEPEVYRKAGFFDMFSGSARELLKRDEDVDIKFAKTFLDNILTVPSLYTGNHPTMEVLAKQAKGICQALGITYEGFPPSYTNSPLGAASWWPIYPEIAQKHGIAYETPMLFKRGSAHDLMLLMTVEEFVRESYQMYDEAGRSVVENCEQVPVIRKQFSFI